MARKTVDFNKSGISKLPDDNRIQGAGGKTNYAGVAQRGRVQERLQEHLPGGKDCVPGARVQIEQGQADRSAGRRAHEAYIRQAGEVTVWPRLIS